MQRGNMLYVLDEPTKGLHPADVEKLVMQLDGLVESGNQSSWWSMTCASPPEATGTWISAPVQEMRAAVW
jgi:predicted ATPase